jgi:glycosyltransferase involved in cell wall biosynthesis
MRIAWLGSARDGGGVPGMGGMLLEGLLNRGAQVDMFTTESDQEIAHSLRGHKNLNIVRTDPRWSWGRWYSRKAFLAFMSSTIARARAYGRLCDLLIARNSQVPYDCIFQLSQTELFKLGRRHKELPPIVVYPCVHAAGELRWHRRESAYARQSESMFMHYVSRIFLIYRSAVQKRELRKPALILGMSHRFNELLSQDYGIDPRRQAVLYHPIRTATNDTLPTQERADSREGRPIRILYVARISVRKGVEQIIELSHRLDDLHGQIQIDVIGDRTQWSNYLQHLKNLNPRTSRYLGALSHDATMSAYGDADLLLLPSMYEPGGLVVGEALSQGVCIVVSDEVGSAEPIEGDCCRKFPAGNVAEFERQTRALIQDVRGRPDELRAHAHAQAVESFAPGKIADQLFGILADVATERRPAATFCNANERHFPGTGVSAE